MKVCRICNVEKELIAFNKASQNSDGLHNWCKLCCKDYNQKNKVKAKKRLIGKEAERAAYLKQYNKTNREVLIEKKRTYYKKNKEAISVKVKISNECNKDKIRLARKIYYENSKDTIIHKVMVYRQTLIGKISHMNSNHKRRAVIKDGDVTTEQLVELYTNNTTCYWCGITVDESNTHLDHYVPLAKGGLHTIDNLVISCVTCNLEKGTKLPEEFLRIKNGNIQVS